MASTRSSTAVLLTLSLVWGSTWIANSMLRDHAGPIHLAMLRYGLSGILLALCYVWRRPGLGSRAAKHSPWTGASLLLGLTMFSLPDLLLVWAAQHGAAAWIPMIYSALPLGLQLVSGQLRAPAVVGVGAMLVLLNGSLPLTAGKLVWVLPVVAAVALQGGSLVYAQRHLAAISSLRGVMVQLLAAAVLLRAALALWPELSGWVRSGPAVGALFALALFATAAAYPLYYWLLYQLEPAQLATSEWLQTLVAVAESAILLQQRPGWPMIGAASVLAGCVILTLRGDSSKSVLQLELSA